MSTLALRRGLFFVVSLFVFFAFAISAQAQSVNLITNGSLETASGAAPAGWMSDYWGTPAPTFLYPATGNAGTKGASVTLASNSSGDAHWNLSAPVTVTPATTYTYSTWYNSTVATEIDAEYTSSGGAVSYAWLADAPSTAGVWKQLTAQFTVPAGITKILPYHLIFSQGTLTIDDISLTSGAGTTTPPAAPRLMLSANPTQITSGQSSTLTWSSTNATGCTASNGWTGAKAVSGSQAVSPTATTTYALTCTGAGGSVTQQVIVGVSAGQTPAPTLTFSATPTLITVGQSSTLSWNAINATGCTASNGWTGAKAVSGTQSVSPTATTTYALSCIGAGGNAAQQVTVNVKPAAPAAPTLTFTAAPTAITSGQSSTLTWSATNATSCTASVGWTGAKAVSGTQSVTPTANTTYTLACTGAGGTVTKSATVTVTAAGAFTEGMVSLSFDDGWLSQYTNALPILQTAGIKATFFLYTQPLQENWADFMTNTQVQDIATKGHEIGGHTVTHAHLPQLSQAKITTELTNSKTYLQNLTGKSVTSLAYPYGELNNTVKTLAQQAGYTAARGTDDDVLSTAARDKYNLTGHCVERTTTIAQVKSWIDQAKANKRWYVLCFHEVRTLNDQYAITPAFLQQVVDYVKSTGIKTVTVAEGRALMGN